MRRHVSHGRAIFESHDARERNKMFKIENLVGLLQRSAEAMKHAAQFSGIRSHDFERVLPGIALMNDDVQAEFHREIELLLKQTRLFRLVGAIVNLCFQLLFSFGLQRVRETCTCFSFATFALGK